MEPGIYYDISHEDYLKLDALSASRLKDFRKSPAHYKHSLENPKSQTDAMLLGSFVHALVLEPAKVVDKYLSLPELDYRSPKNREIRDNLIAENPGVTFLKQDDWQKGFDVSRTVLANKRVDKILSGAKVEVSAVFEIEEILCKARFDIWNQEIGVIADIKTCQDASFNSFARNAYQRGYHFQAAWYREAAKILGHDLKGFAIVAVETNEPYGVKVYEVSPPDMDKAIEQTRKHIQLYRDCKATNSWPSYGEDIEVLTLPTWADEPTENMEVRQ